MRLSHFKHLLIIPFIIHGTSTHANSLSQKLSLAIKNNPNDLDSFYLYNKELVKEKRWDLVSRYMNKYYPQIHNEYYQILFKNLYYKNTLNFTADTFKANNNNTGTSLNLDYSHRINSGDIFTLGFKNDSRNFNGDILTAKEYAIGYQTLLSRILTYQASLSHSPENLFLATYSLSQMFYMPATENTSINFGLRNSFFEKANRFNHTFIIGGDYYYQKNIFSANSYLTINPYKTLLSMTLSHIYSFSYKHQIRSHLSFGESLDDIHLISGFKEFGVKYTYNLKQWAPSVFVNHYQSKYRLENKLGVQIQWKF